MLRRDGLQSSSWFETTSDARLSRYRSTGAAAMHDEIHVARAACSSGVMGAASGKCREGYGTCCESHGGTAKLDVVKAKVFSEKADQASRREPKAGTGGAALRCVAS